jgi:transposase InsO family protein
VHDAFLNDSLDGPLAVTDYSAQLFWVTKGRCYSRAEYRSWFTEAGLKPSMENIPTQLDYGLIWARKENQ